MSELYKFPFETQKKFIKGHPFDSFLGNGYPEQYHEYYTLYYEYIADKMIEKLPELTGLDADGRGYLIDTIRQSQEPLQELIKLPEEMSKLISGFSHFTEGWTIIKDAVTDHSVDSMIGDDIPDFFEMAVENNYGCFTLSNSNAFFDDRTPGECVKSIINTNDFSYKRKNPAVSKAHPSLYIAPGAPIKLLIEKERIGFMVTYDKDDKLKVERHRSSKGNKMEKKKKKSKKRINSRKKKNSKKKKKKKKNKK